jgi:hypothetical protein
MSTVKRNTDIILLVSRQLLVDHCDAYLAESLRRKKRLNTHTHTRDRITEETRLSVLTTNTLAWATLVRLHVVTRRAQEIMTMIKRSFNLTARLDAFTKFMVWKVGCSRVEQPVISTRSV